MDDALQVMNKAHEKKRSIQKKWDFLRNPLLMRS